MLERACGLGFRVMACRVKVETAVAEKKEVDA